MTKTFDLPVKRLIQRRMVVKAPLEDDMTRMMSPKYLARELAAVRVLLGQLFQHRPTSFWHERWLQSLNRPNGR